jgi:hypothetical protein
MRSFSTRLAVLVAVVMGGVSSSVWAFGNRASVETVYLDPTPAATILPTVYEPTSWVVPTSYESSAWVTPTSYFLPTSATYSTVYPTSYSTVYPTSYSTVYPTSYVSSPVVVAPTVYALETTYYRRGLFGRRWRVDRPVIAAYPTGYLPTAYYLPSSSRTFALAPTALRDTGLVRMAYVNAADCPCPSPSGSAATPLSTPAPTAGSKSVQSRAVDDLPVTSSAVGPAPRELDFPAARSGAGENSQGAAVNSSPASKATDGQGALENPGAISDNTPPTPRPAAKAPTKPAAVTPDPPKPAASTGTAKSQPFTPSQPATGANANENLAPPKAPQNDPGDIQSLPLEPGTLRRDSQRPTYAATPRLGSSPARNVLYGMVESGAAGEPEEGVRVTLASLSQSVANRITMTNAFGKFAVRVPDGQWDVMVTMPSGRQRLVEGPLGRITVRDGQITDQEGHVVPSVIITR